MTAFDLPAARSAIAVNKPTADAIDEWLDDDSSPDRVCRKCGGDFHVPYDLDPTPIDDTPPDAPSTASTIDYARKYLAADSEGELTLQEFQALCFATVLVRVAAARSQQAAKIEQLEAEIAVLRERKAKADATDGIVIPRRKRRVLLDLAPATASLLLESVRAAYPAIHGFVRDDVSAIERVLVEALEKAR